MSTSVKPFLSSQSILPAVSGQAGTLKAALKTGLVTGAGASTVTINVSAGIATVTYPAAHQRLPYGVELIAGATGAGAAALNGERRLKSTPTATTATFATTAPDGAATGTITTKVAPAAWAELFGSGNFSALKPSVPEASGSVLRVDDSGTKNARVRSFEGMTDIDTGLGPSPTDAQISGGGFWPKSATADATARDWFVIADNRGALVGVAPMGGGRYSLRWWGDIASLRSGDAWSALLTCDSLDQTAISSVPEGCVTYSGRTTTRKGAYLQRSYTGIGAAISALRIGAHQNGSATDAWAGTAGYSLGNHPNGPNNGLMLCPVELWEGPHQRGTIPGLWHPYLDCGNAFGTGDIVDGTESLAGRKLMAVRTAGPGAADLLGTAFIDVTGPWGR